ncbi:unnamed protein product [Macrosiphum euphorbiae]|uniref:Uncharacterized protein n=1 Tax=Macrosiphum euphorbiae TaxID=13131 RepID=A0AAV0W107_9HEMI|nr:unnamed protein product [Macrosiphum euphorbiae]
MARQRETPYNRRAAAALKLRQRVDRTGSFDLAFRPYPSTVDENKKNERNGNDDDILTQLFDLGFTPYPVGKNIVVYRVDVSMSMLFTGPIYRLSQLPP